MKISRTNAIPGTSAERNINEGVLMSFIVVAEPFRDESFWVLEVVGIFVEVENHEVYVAAFWNCFPVKNNVLVQVSSVPARVIE